MMETNIYSNNDAVSMAKKIKRLQTAGVSFDIRITKGIAGENVVALSWDQTRFEDAEEDLAEAIIRLGSIFG